MANCLLEMQAAAPVEGSACSAIIRIMHISHLVKPGEQPPPPGLPSPTALLQPLAGLYRFAQVPGLWGGPWAWAPSPSLHPPLIPCPLLTLPPPTGHPLRWSYLLSVPHHSPPLHRSLPPPAILALFLLFLSPSPEPSLAAWTSGLVRSVSEQVSRVSMPLGWGRSSWSGVALLRLAPFERVPRPRPAAVHPSSLPEAP